MKSVKEYSANSINNEKQIVSQICDYFKTENFDYKITANAKTYISVYVIKKKTKEIIDVTIDPETSRIKIQGYYHYIFSSIGDYRLLAADLISEINPLQDFGSFIIDKKNVISFVYTYSYMNNSFDLMVFKLYFESIATILDIYYNKFSMFLFGNLSDAEKKTWYLKIRKSAILLSKLDDNEK